MTVFTVHISAESCTVNLLYGISKLVCKIDQRELEYSLMAKRITWCVLLYTYHGWQSLMSVSLS